MHLWTIPLMIPVLLGYYRLSEKLTISLDFLLFEIIMCGILYFVTKGILMIKVKKLEQANENANSFFEHISQEPDSLHQNKCLTRCLNVSNAALNEYDSLLMYLGNLQNQPSRKVCTQSVPIDFKSGEISSEESLQYLGKDVSVPSENLSVRFATDPIIEG